MKKKDSETMGADMAQSAVGGTEQEEIKKLLRHNLTNTEKREIGTDMARAVSERTAAENDLKTIKAQMNSRIAEAEAKISLCASLLNAGYDMRETPCLLVRDFNEKTVTVTRVDLDEVVSSRPMEAHELQPRLPETDET